MKIEFIAEVIACKIIYIIFTWTIVPTHCCYQNVSVAAPSSGACPSGYPRGNFKLKSLFNLLAYIVLVTLLMSRDITSRAYLILLNNCYRVQVYIARTRDWTHNYYATKFTSQRGTILKGELKPNLLVVYCCTAALINRKISEFGDKFLMYTLFLSLTPNNLWDIFRLFAQIIRNRPLFI